MLPATLAIFDDTITLAGQPRSLHRYAILRTTPYEGGYIFRVVPGIEEALPISGGAATDTLGCYRIMPFPVSTTMQRTLIWKTGWTVDFDGEEVPVIDLECRDIAKKYEFSIKRTGDTMLACRERQSAQRFLRLSALNVNISHFSAEPSVTPLRIPTFVAKLVKDELIRKEDICPITSNRFETDLPAALTACFHAFDPEALQAWLKLKKECPTCRAPVLNTMII